MIFTIISPDKISLSTFCEFYRTLYLNGVKNETADMSCLFDGDYQRTVLESYKEEFKDGVLLIRYKIKLNTKIDQLPDSVTKLSDHAIRFDMYSYEPVVLVTSDQTFLTPVLERFRQNIKKLNGTR